MVVLIENVYTAAENDIIVLSIVLTVELDCWKRYLLTRQA